MGAIKRKLPVQCRCKFSRRPPCPQHIPQLYWDQEADIKLCSIISLPRHWPRGCSLSSRSPSATLVPELVSLTHFFLGWQLRPAHCRGSNCATHACFCLAASFSSRRNLPELWAWSWRNEFVSLSKCGSWIGGRGAHTLGSGCQPRGFALCSVCSWRLPYASGTSLNLDSGKAVTL